MSASVALKCVNCSAPLRSEDWNMEAGIIKCSHCGVLSLMPGRNGGGNANAFRPRPEVPLPPSMTFEETPFGIEIKHRWFSGVVFFLLPFCLVWNGFLVFWYYIAFQKNAPLAMKFFPLIHVAVGLGLAYVVLSLLFNKTTIAASSGRLTVKHGPVPWWGNVELDSSEITQFFCKEKVHRSKNGPRYQYEIWSVHRDATTKKVVGASLDMDQALYVEQRLEKALGIQDRAVPGEVER
ncbi:hypothetical protein AYO49_01240 [Verrucomicrobiaceae bacterium SCGC AG-212-N21]|nr:hypothetical protein AYO49_01240 [Verrucomicrobiaceae bacterium SCGC AG-212-N21]